LTSCWSAAPTLFTSATSMIWPQANTRGSPRRKNAGRMSAGGPGAEPIRWRRGVLSRGSSFR
jgi:hypothetical protein